MSAIGVIPASASSGNIHWSKRYKPLSNTSCFDHLPEDVFAEILCRLSCHKLLVRCKLVSKRWYRVVSFLISDSSFITSFIRLKRDSKTPVVRTLLNSRGKDFRVTKVITMKMRAEELVPAVTRESDAGDEALVKTTDFVEQSHSVVYSKPLASLFKSLVSLYGLKKEPVPVVVATCNDLVLCQLRKHAYLICNPYTKQVVALPRASASYEFLQGTVVGFICHLDKCRVVRIPQTYGPYSSELKVEIFSSETGVWRWSVISFIQPIGLSINITYTYNGMLYWETYTEFGCTFIGFDPFMINSSSSSSSSSSMETMDHYKGRIIEFFGKSVESIKCVGVCGGRLRFIGSFHSIYRFRIWELEEEEQAQDRSGKLLLKCTWYSLDREMIRDRDTLGKPWRVFDPNDENMLYLRCYFDPGHIYRCNIRTGKWSKVLYPADGRDYHFQLTLVPWWPTAVPKIFKRICRKSKKQNYKDKLIEQQVKRYT